MRPRKNAYNGLQKREDLTPALNEIIARLADLDRICQTQKWNTEAHYIKTSACLLIKLMRMLAERGARKGRKRGR